LRAAVPREALGAKWQGGTVRDLARDVVTIARDGLRARGEIGADGQDERSYLAPLESMVDGGLTQAEQWLGRYNTDWSGDASRILMEAMV
jgi:glutamate--cysteine ligase